MSKHTPGPWLTEGNFVYALNGEGKHAVNRFHASIQGGYTSEDTRTTIAETEANAKLIAAAPDLLAAMRFILAFYEPGQTCLDTNAWKQAEAAARAAVAKAES